MRKLNSYSKRAGRNRSKLKKVSLDRFRITVFKSSKNISAQIIDDKINKTIVSASSTEKEMKRQKKENQLSVVIGELLKKNTEKISKVYFDRGGYRIMEELKLSSIAEKMD